MDYKLPKLPYSYGALEPYIDEETVRIHHDKHHASYVNGLNNAIQELFKLRESKNFSLIKHWERELSFNGSGNILHTIYWQNMSPTGKRKPDGELICRIDRDFNNYNNFKNQFTNAAEKVEGSGWACLIWSNGLQSLQIIQIEKHQNWSIIDGYPLLVCDVWEHAYYIKYQNKRASYIKNWWKLIDWNNVETRYFRAIS
ncbi:superoxide dismutase [Clostridium sp. DL1XJH146]